MHHDQGKAGGFPNSLGESERKIKGMDISDKEKARGRTSGRKSKPEILRRMSISTNELILISGEEKKLGI